MNTSITTQCPQVSSLLAHSIGPKVDLLYSFAMVRSGCAIPRHGCWRTVKFMCPPNTSPQPGSLIPRQEAGDGKQAACVDTNTADVNSLSRSEVLTLRCLLSRQSQTVPQRASVPLQVCPELDSHARS